jgi:hypothetical protein
MKYQISQIQSARDDQVAFVGVGFNIVNERGAPIVTFGYLDQSKATNARASRRARGAAQILWKFEEPYSSPCAQGGSSHMKPGTAFRRWELMGARQTSSRRGSFLSGSGPPSSATQCPTTGPTKKPTIRSMPTSADLWLLFLPSMERS